MGAPRKPHPAEAYLIGGLVVLVLWAILKTGTPFGF